MISFKTFSKDLLAGNKKVLGILGCGVAALAGSVFFATPYLSANDLKKALESQDAAAVSGHIDFATLKTNLKSMVQSQMLVMAMQQQQAGNPFGMLGIGVNSSYVDKVLDQFVSPEGVAGLFQASKTDPKMNTQKWVADAQSQTNITMGYEAFDQFAVKLQDKKNPKISAQLIFSRQGLTWKVSNVRLSNAAMNRE